MKKIFFAIIGFAMFLTGCKSEDLYIEQNPYRLIGEYGPQTYEMTVSGTLTPDESYDWITMAQSGDKVSFTLRRNTTGLVREAKYTIAGQSLKAMVFQKAHSLDAVLTPSIKSQGASSAVINVNLSTKFVDDYDGWGIIYGKTADITKGQTISQSSAPKSGDNEATLTNLEKGGDYYIWAYVKSTEGDIINSGMVAMISPVFVSAGDNLQAAIDGAKEYSEIRVQGGVTFQGPINLTNANANKVISGGWGANFSEQSSNNLTVIDGAASSRGFWCAEDDNTPLNKSVEISYFEIKNCKGDHGSAVHVCGGPVTIHHCYVHDNACEKGAIGTREEDYSSTITVYNCKVSNNISDGHGAAFGFGDGASYEDQVQAIIVNNLIVDNFSDCWDGYCSTFICYNNTDLVFVNNTVVGNKNFMEESGNPYPGTNFRGNVRALLANNIFAGNFTSVCQDDPVFVRQDGHLGMGGGKGTLCNNIIEGSIVESENCTLKDNVMESLGFDLTTIITTDYYPVGAAVGGGSLQVVKYMENRDSDPKELDLMTLLQKYNTDLAGNPRISNGKVDIGCYQAR